MRILVFHPLENDGTSFYRAYGPLSALQRKHNDIHLTNAKHHDISWDFLRQFDVLFMQRPASRYHFDFAELAKRYGIPVWLDWDDHYLAIPEDNPRKKLYTEYHVDQVREVAKIADAITVSTEPLSEVFSQFNENVFVIPNAHDFDLLSDNDMRVFSGTSKVILWRGSDTHQGDFDHFKEPLIELMNETTDYVWAFFGHCPKWAIDVLPSNRIRLYGYDGVVEYIRRMAEVNPRLVYIPLVDNEFNRARSNIGWIEATYAGAVTLMPNNMPTWKDLPGFYYNDAGDFKEKFLHALENASDEIQGEAAQKLLTSFRLEKVNELRRQLLGDLVTRRIRTQDKKPSEVKPFTDQEFFEYGKTHGWTQLNSDWIKGQEKTAKLLTETLGAKSVLDIGCGTGALIEVLLNQGVVAMGVDSNPYNKEFFVRRNPKFGPMFIQGNAQDFRPGEYFDAVVSIETFEHMPDEVCTQVLYNVWDKCKWFLFTSTPYHSTPDFDRQWGHINVKPTEHWIKFFEERGFKLFQRLDWPTKWAVLFISTNYTPPDRL